MLVNVNLPSFVMMPLWHLVLMVCLVLHMVVASDANNKFYFWAEVFLGCEGPVFDMLSFFNVILKYWHNNKKPKKFCIFVY